MSQKNSRKYCYRFLFCAEIKEAHTQKDEYQIERFATDIFFSEQECAGYEADDDTAATYHRDDRNHGVGVAEGVEIYEVGTNEK